MKTENKQKVKSENNIKTNMDIDKINLLNKHMIATAIEIKALNN